MASDRRRTAPRPESPRAFGERGIAFCVMLAFFAGRALLHLSVFLMKVLCFALFACAFNLLIGYVGLLSFGHAMYFGMGELCQRACRQGLGLPPELAILPARDRRVLGLVFGSLAIRRQGIYFAMITLALAQMVYFFCLQAPFTGGEDGIQAVPRGHLFGVIDLADDLTMYWFVLAIFLPASC
jgi:branched-chain amino acid transport system permease protein